MDLQKIWDGPANEDESLQILLSKGKFNEMSSRLPLKGLKSKLFAGIILAMVITIAYIVFLFFDLPWQVALAFGILILFNTIIIIQSLKLYRQTPSGISTTNGLKEELELHYNSFQRWWQVQQKMGLFVYPVAATGGFILGGFWGSGQPVAAFLYNAKMLTLLGATLLVVVPVCYLAAQWIFQQTYGKYLRCLRKSINELD